MALSLLHLFKAQAPDGSKVHTTVSAILALLSGASVKSLYEAEANTNAFTDAEKTKLAGLDDNHFKGTFTTVAALNAVTGVAGDYGDVDAGAGNDIQRYIWDVDDSKWVEQSGAVTAETAGSIKSKYESNPDTNAYTDAASAKVDNLTVSAPVNLDNLASDQHAAVTLGANSGLQISGQVISDDFSLLPAA